MTDWRDDEWEALMERTRATDDPGAPEPLAPTERPGFWVSEGEDPGASWAGSAPARIEPSVTSWATTPEEWSAGADAWAADAGTDSGTGGGVAPWEAGGSWADPDPVPTWDAETTGAMPLPHWTEPPTGEIPRITDDTDDWSAVTGAAPRFRSESGDWAAGDFEAGELAHDDSTLVGALDENPAAEAALPMTRRQRREVREAGSTRRGRRGGRRDETDADPTTGAAAFGDPDLDAPDPARDDFGAVVDDVTGPIVVGAATGSLEGGPRPAPEHGRHDSGADTNRRVVTAGVAAAVAVICFLLGSIPTLLLAMVVVGLGAAEMFDSLRRSGYHPATLVGLVGCVAIVPLAYDQGIAAFPMMFFLVTAFTMLWYLFEVTRARPTVNVALTLLVFAYVGGFGAFAGLLLAPEHGVGYVLGVVLCVIAYDVVGWFVGRSMGRTPLMKRVSPNKTVEGLLGGMIAALIMGVVVVSVVGGWKQGGFADGLLLGLAMAVAAPLGDLVESMFKRDLGIKDFGNLLPGHGGVLDRFDALLFALPIAYYIALHIVT